MSVISSTSGEVTANVNLTVTTPTIARPVTSGTPNTETSYALPNSSRRFLISNQGSSIIKLAFASGQSGTLYKTLEPYSFYSESNLGAVNLTLYFQSPGASQQLEVVSWV